LESLITKPEVEAKLLIRLQKKVDTYSPDIAADGDSPKPSSVKELKKPNGGKIDTDGVLDLYESYIIPLTKEVEVSDFHALATGVNTASHQVDYLLHRLDGMDEETVERIKKKDF